MNSQISSLAYSVIERTDLNGWREFSENSIGAQSGRVVEGESLPIRPDDKLEFYVAGRVIADDTWEVVCYSQASESVCRSAPS